LHSSPSLISFLYCYAHPLYLHPFPTRRSSDLSSSANAESAVWLFSYWRYCKGYFYCRHCCCFSCSYSFSLHDALPIYARRIGNQWYEEDASLSGPSRIAISYGQPHARGRKIEGGLIPIDTVWRFGANMATALHSDVDITLGDLKVPRGDYSLFIQYTRTGYTLIVNRG